ncbi:MAG: hypothetical protein H0U67_15380 [Gemmatimonadetes bacterium]|nr:hypothetical protein [Gemmatimonadota bacterium]
MAEVSTRHRCHLPAADAGDSIALRSVSRCESVSGDPSILGVILSHGHPDHYGLIGEVHGSIPRYLGEATQRILAEAEFFSPFGVSIPPGGFLVDRQPLEIGPFRVTPYLVDHSAFDSYALMVEGGGRRLFYSGDLRAHGRKGALFEQLLSTPPKGVDVLLLEGTNLRSHGSKAGLSESRIETECVEAWAGTKGIALACYSPQNTDRLVTLSRAARRPGRVFVMDLYAATIARATGRRGLSTIGSSPADGADWA